MKNKTKKPHKFLGKPNNFNYKNSEFTEKYIKNVIQSEYNNSNNIEIIQPIQNHSNKIIEITHENKTNSKNSFHCDGIWTQEKNIVLSIKTADCMALILKHKKKKIIANIHAGWRGVANKITSNFLQNFSAETNNDFEVYFSPSILSCCCEFTNPYTETPEFFHEFVTEKTENNHTKYFINLQEIIKKELIENSINPENIFFTDICTKCSNTFWSHRCKEIERNIAYVYINS